MCGLTKMSCSFHKNNRWASKDYLLNLTHHYALFSLLLYMYINNVKNIVLVVKVYCSSSSSSSKEP